MTPCEVVAPTEAALDPRLGGGGVEKAFAIMGFNETIDVSGVSLLFPLGVVVAPEQTDYVLFTAAC